MPAASARMRWSPILVKTRSNISLQPFAGISDGELASRPRNSSAALTPPPGASRGASGDGKFGLAIAARRKQVSASRPTATARLHSPADDRRCAAVPAPDELALRDLNKITTFDLAGWARSRLPQPAFSAHIRK